MKIQGVDPDMADAAGQVLSGYFFGKIGESLSSGLNSLKNVFSSIKGTSSTVDDILESATISNC